MTRSQSVVKINPQNLELSREIVGDCTLYTFGFTEDDFETPPRKLITCQFNSYKDKSMRVLVTGCGGFLGREIVRQLLDRGDEVIGVSRSIYPELLKWGIEHRQGDLADKKFVNQAISGVQTVIHTAAVAGVWGPRCHFEKNNVTATHHVLQACKQHGIINLIFTSSPSVTFDGHHQRGVDESEPYPTRWLCHYPRTKALAEQQILDAHDLNGVRTLALRPHLVWGEDDPHILPRLLLRAKQGRLRIVGDGKNRVDTVHVINAAGAHLDAIDALHNSPETAGGQPYFIAQDEPVDCWGWIREICEIWGVKPPSKHISFDAAYRLGAILETAYQLMRKSSEPPMTRFVASQLAKDHYFDISAAKSRLNYTPRISMSEGLLRLRERWEATPPR